jgi:hypothetical protein
MLTADCPRQSKVTAEKDPPKYRTRDGACAYIRAKHGVPLSESTVDKLAMLGEFARVAAYWGRRPLYANADLDAWVQARLRRRADVPNQLNNVS